MLQQFVTSLKDWRISMQNNKHIQQYIINELTKIICKHELYIYQLRHSKMKTRMQRYFNSTPLRNAFARVVVYAYAVNKHYSIQKVASKLYTTRQSISKIVEEAEAEGWLHVKRSSNSVEIQASEEMYAVFQDYVEIRKQLLPKQERDHWNELLLLQSLVESNIALDAWTSIKLDDVVDISDRGNVLEEEMLS